MRRCPCINGRGDSARRERETAKSIKMAASAVQQQQQNKSIIEIYTDWTNHYLDKLKGRQRIRDLQTELADGLVLADVIEAVTSARVPDIVRKPKTSAQVSIDLIL